MASLLKCGVHVLGGFNDNTLKSKTGNVSLFRLPPKPHKFDFMRSQKGFRDQSLEAQGRSFTVQAQASICVSKASKWWEKTLQPNMIEIRSAQELVDSLLSADDRLVIVDFYSPGCGGCRTLHPKICRLAESHPNAIFLKVNYEELKTMCHTLRIHVLPFFKFYRGADGHLCSFSCTNATIKKFKDAMAKHGADRCGLGPAKGLNDDEILKLVAAGELPLNLPLLSAQKEAWEDLVKQSYELPDLWSRSGNKADAKEEAAVL